MSGIPQPWRGALQAALLGDALGVPHEFKPGHALPPQHDIRMVMPPEYPKTYETIRYGLWSDDGSQILALLDALVRGGGHYDESLFLDNMLGWWHGGKFQAGGQVFDIGGQTRYALEQRESGQDLTCGPSSGRCGNGSLMRVLPVAFLPDMFGTSQEEALQIAMRQSDLTHPHALARACCALYVEMCWTVVARTGGTFQEMVEESADRLRHRAMLKREELASLSAVLAFGKHEMPTGTGFVVNTFWSAICAVARSTSMSDALRAAISFGNDTDTVACLTGGLAALCHDVDELSWKWWQAMDLNQLRPLTQSLSARPPPVPR